MDVSRLIQTIASIALTFVAMLSKSMSYQRSRGERGMASSCHNLRQKVRFRKCFNYQAELNRTQYAALQYIYRESKRSDYSWLV